MKLTTASAAAAAMLFAASGPVWAQSAQERAAALKEWRANCAQEDPDLRLAFIEDAIANQSATIAGICARLALESTDADTRALGLRSALAMKEVVTFSFELPAAYQAALAEAEAEDDGDAIAEVKKAWQYTLKSFRDYGGTMSFKQKKVSVDDATGEWRGVQTNGEFSQNYEVVSTVTANRLKFEGRNTNDSITLDLTLIEGGLLQGSLMIDDYGPYPVIAELL